MENSINIKIGNETYILKQTFRAIMYFEELTKKSVSNADDNLSDLITMFYCLLKAANKDSFKYTLDEFIDALDDNQEQIEVFNNYLLTQAQAQPQGKKKVKKA